MADEPLPVVLGEVGVGEGKGQDSLLEPGRLIQLSERIGDADDAGRRPGVGVRQDGGHDAGDAEDVRGNFQCLEIETLVVGTDFANLERGRAIDGETQALIAGRLREPLHGDDALCPLRRRLLAQRRWR